MVVDDEGSLEQRPPTELPQPLLLFPAIVDLNSRMRKLIAYFQRHQRAEYLPTVTAQPYMEQRLIKWSRREEADFYRVVSSYGVEQVMKAAESATDPSSSPQRKRSPKKRVFAGYNWNNFKQLANLAKKSDQAITEYYNSFFTMCHRVCKKKLPEVSGPVARAPTDGSFNVVVLIPCSTHAGPKYHMCHVGVFHNSTIEPVALV
ncbi:unnamed protein product [Dibothriocephalus latus]|uniref:Chromodomain-helicase-DNA-binding protein 6-9 tri-helical domain-containing protein n=1 Tax=Dibothriocephalus latus TaxID=60516 RepID=A0A3P7LZ54_DIBLA|nr:unnamed protein product [Dibothriocephalus latus]